jgi:hypothetical protein
MSKVSLRYLAFPLLLFSLCCSACAHHLQPAAGESYSDPKGYFEVSMSWLNRLRWPLGQSHLRQNGWQLLSWKKVNFVLWDSRTGATIVVDVNPLKEDLDLVTLTNHLLIAFEGKRIISRDTAKIDGREALKTVLEAWVEGTEIKAEIYVVQGAGVCYDIIFWAPQDAFPRKEEAFRQFLAGITFLQP